MGRTVLRELAMKRGSDALLRQLVAALATMATSQSWPCGCTCAEDWSCARCVVARALEAARVAGYYKGPLL